MLPENILNALKTFYQLINGKNIPWILSGSTSLVIQDVDVGINNDIDILTTQQGTKQIDILLADYRIKEPKYSVTEQYKSFFGQYKINDVNIDVIGEFQYRLKDGSWSKLNQNHQIFIKKFQEMSLPLLSLEQELEEYQNLDRNDKAEKIRKILTKIK